MTSPTPDHWQIQEAKQRFSEMIRAVTSQGPQVITRHGDDIAVVLDIGEYRRLTRPAVDLAGILLGGPKLDDRADWIAATPPDRLYVSVLTLGEIEQGIARVRGRGDRHQASALERWLRDVETGFEDRVLPVTLLVAAAWGRQQYAQPLPVIDALLAATARVHGMTVVTRNAKDFELAGVQVLNPFAE